MDVNINFIGFDSESLEAIDFEPKNIFINFHGKEAIFQQELLLLAEIIQKFNDSKIYFSNLNEQPQQELRFVVEGYENVEVLLK